MMPAILKSLNRYETAKCLARVKAEILHNWEEQARERVPAAKEKNRLALRDSLPQFLDQMIIMLASADPKVDTEISSKVAREHAEERSNSPEYSLDQVIFEYSIIRSVIIKSLESKGQVDSQSLNVIHEFIDKSIRKGAVRYTEIETNRQADLTVIKADKEVGERSNEAKSSFLANMSHEIRTPLGAIMGFVGLLQDAELSQKESSKYLSIINRNSHHLLRIIDDVLDLAKVESGKMTIEKVEFSFVEFLAEFSSIMSFEAREKAIGFEFKAETLLPELVISDPTRLRQIMTNVVGNAIKFTAKGRVELTAVFADHRLKFRVKDSGRGISPEQRPLLFQAFSQADSTTTRIFGGTGLGLVLTRKLCQALGGDFKLVDSEIGKGSTFEVNIPVSSPAETKLVPLKNIEFVPIVKTNTSTRQIALRDFEILVVEDSPDNQMLIQMMLTKTGAKITLANDGREGVISALAHNYDVILMDIQMPNVDGHDAVRTLRSKGYLGPIVALTAHAMKEEQEKAFQSGFSHFLTKPIDRKSLIDLIELIHGQLRVSL